MKIYGTLGRSRFSIKFPDGTIQRFGCCNPKVDDGRIIVQKDGEFFLRQELHGEDLPPVEDIPLPLGCLVTNGYYDHEHDGWIPITHFET